MNWINIKGDWFLKNRRYLYDDILKEAFVKHYDFELEKYLYEFIPSEMDITLIKAIAEEKSKHTYDHNQDDYLRMPQEKINKQFEGCLAELAVTKFLIQIIGEKSEHVHIYDAERPDFEYHPNEEYDVLVEKEHGVRKKCEVRNSWSYKTTITEFCNGYGDVIGTYTNTTKQSEELADFFIRPVLQLNSLQENIPMNTFELMMNQSARLYIVAACTKQEMIDLGHYNHYMTKNQTIFWTTKINKLQSVDKFVELYNTLFYENRR